MIKVLGLSVSIFVFALVFFAAPTQAKGNPHDGSPPYGNPHLTIVLDVPDEGDNEHPSGKDRSVEPGKSGTQGNSDSDPDDDGRGPDRSNNGPDKQPDGAGGVDRGDQDNNNGCGNDDDFEDDNEGWCGGKPKDDPGNGDNGDNGDGGNGNGGDGNGDNGDGNGDNGNGNGNGDEEENGEPTPKEPEAEEGQVLGIDSLPSTGGEDNSKRNLSIILSLFLGGITLKAINKRFALAKDK
jgi:hypothetical protein